MTPHLFDDPQLAGHILKLQGPLLKGPERPQRAARRKETTVGTLTGFVTFWHADRGFGFVATGADEECFIGARALTIAGISNLKKGDKLTFDRVESKKYPNKFEARNIALLDREAA